MFAFIKHCILATVMVLAMGFNAIGQDADKILQDSRSKIESLKDLSANFSYTIKNISGRSAEKSGSLKYKDGMYVADLGDQVIYCDGETQWVYEGSVEEVYINDYDPEEGLNVDEIFDIYDKSVQSRLDGEETVQGQACYKVFLAIKDPSLDYNQATIWIGKRDKLPYKVTFVDRNQTQTIFAFSNLRTNAGLTLSDFQWSSQKHPEARMIDERL